MSTQAMDRVARHNWRQDGEPEWSPSEPGSVGYYHYREAARQVITGLVELGYVIKRPAPKKTKAGSAPQQAEQGGKHE